MVVPTGTASPWRETGDTGACYLRDGHETGSADLLAEAMRADGVTRSTFPAICIAEEASLSLGWYGYVDESPEETRCDVNGETNDGETVDEPRPCVYALIDLKDA